MAAGPDVLTDPDGARPDRAWPIRVVVAKVGLDGHEAGARVVARGLMEEGMEVIYTGLRRTPEQVVTTAEQEDADVIGVSILSGAHGTLLPRIRELMDERGLDDVLLVAGGIVPDADVERLKGTGVHEVFHPGTTIPEIATFIRSRVRSEAVEGSPPANG
ncbi:MAG: cobalamin B12-binding domain-containing protein [bacterium]|jgi:methylmalonyl-CoA mutase C-terminal domain/subunit|nr:cobalamin B12-binding domain-containing protein [bacterium]